MKSHMFLLVLLLGWAVSAQDITISKDSLKIYNNPVSSLSDGIIVVNHGSSYVFVDSAFIEFEEFDTAGSTQYGLDGRLQAQWCERNTPAGNTYWDLTNSGDGLYSMKQRGSAASNPVPLGLGANGDTLKISMMEIGTCLQCSGVPTWFPPYVRGRMELRFTNGQKIFIRLYSDDLRTDQTFTPCDSYECDSMVVRAILDENKMTDVSAISFATIANNRIVSLMWKYLITAAVSLPMQLTKLSSDIGRLSELGKLDVSGNNLDSLPESIIRCSKLEYLFLDRNSLVKLPDSISKLQSLKTISVTVNKLTSLPPGIEKLSSLNLFYISRNSICTLPDNVIDWMKKLQTYISSSRYEPMWPDSQSCGGTGIGYNPSISAPAANKVFRSITQKNGLLIIQAAHDVKSVSLFNAAGRVVSKKDALSLQQGFSTFKLNTGNLKSGAYYLSAETGKTNAVSECVRVLPVGPE